MNTTAAVLCVLCVGALWASSEGARILGVFPYYGRSHFVMFESLMKGLAAKGHDVTVVSHFPQDKPIPNYKDLSLKGSGMNLINNISADQAKVWRSVSVILYFIWRIAGVQLCEDMLQHPILQGLLDPKAPPYDVFVSELWGSDCFLGIAHKLGIPHIAMITTAEVPWSLGRYGGPLNPAYQTNYFTKLSYRGMSFWERFYNTFYLGGLAVGYNLFSTETSNAVMHKHLGESLPHLSDIIYNSSLLFINGHFSTHQPRPFPPNIIEVGGLHIPEPKPLPAELQKYLDDAKEGVIVFSLGSMIKAETFDQQKIDSFVEAFRSLKQQVLWKFDGEIKNQPKNIRLTKWLPQVDVLRHPNIKAFITHGGLMGTQEAVLHGVPIIGMPFFADQRANILNYKYQGVAEIFSLEEVTYDVVLSTLRKVLDDPSYLERARHLSKLFKDRPHTPLETAIFWTEYVIRHKGAHHLRPVATSLHWYQYYLLDVMAVVFILLVAVSFISYKILALVLGLFCGKKSSKGASKKVKKN